MSTRVLLAVVLAAQVSVAADNEDPATIMARVAANVEKATDERMRYVYRQLVRSSLVRSNGQTARKERREYSVAPGPKNTEKKLTSFSGEYRKGKEMVPYSEPGFKYKELDIDGELFSDLTEDLVNSKESRDGIPHRLFPLRTKALDSYTFTWKGETVEKDRRIYQIGFEPSAKRCEGHRDDCDEMWAGDAWIDAEELQPVRIQTRLTFKMPWGVRVFLGTNLRQTGFSIRYARVAPNVWFPVSYGTEFRLDVLWRYKRTITLSLESDGFRRTDVKSDIQYGEPTP